MKMNSPKSTTHAPKQEQAVEIQKPVRTAAMEAPEPVALEAHEPAVDLLNEFSPRARYKLYDIDYDTDGEKVEGLPTEIFVDVDGECEISLEGADMISNQTGWCVNSFSYEVVNKDVELCEKNGISLAHVPGNEQAWDWTHSSGASAYTTFGTKEAAARNAVETLELDRKVPNEEWIYPGAEVFWNDPDEDSDCSCYGIVARVHTEGPITEDSVVIVHRHDGTDMECFARELS